MASTKIHPMFRSAFFSLTLVACNNYNLLEKLENPFKIESCGSSCRIFSTTNPHSGNLGGVSGADTHCLNDPGNPSRSSRIWRAMISDGSVRRACSSVSCGTSGSAENINWALKPLTAYHRIDGTPIGTTAATGVFATTLTNPIGPGGTGVWTGLNSNWQNDVNCNAWTVADATQGRFGSTGGTTDDAINSNTANCSSGQYLYCVEQ